jgi:hypothetical protein
MPILGTDTVRTVLYFMAWIPSDEDTDLKTIKREELDRPHELIV